MAKRAEKAAVTRDKLIAAAKALFLARGYEAVSIRDVAQGAGLSTGAIFAHWGGKDELWEAAMRSPAPSARRLRAFLDQVQATAAGLPLGHEAFRLARDLYGAPAP